VCSRRGALHEAPSLLLFSQQLAPLTPQAGSGEQLVSTSFADDDERWQEIWHFAIGLEFYATAREIVGRLSIRTISSVFVNKN